MILIDSHCHLDHPRFEDDLDEVITNAQKAGVKAIISQGVNLTSNKRVLELSKKYPIVKAAMGLYPIEAPNVRIKENLVDDYIIECEASVDETIDFIRAHKKDIVAIGEVGIDLKESDDFESQKENFNKLIALAKEIKKPLIIHSRKAEEQVLDLLEESNIPKGLVHLHCFCGKKKFIDRGVKLGYTFSIPCSITRAQNFQILTQKVPITQLLTETDGPYMPPNRAAEKSLPQDVQITIKEIARIKGMDEQEVAHNIYMNYQRMYS